MVYAQIAHNKRELLRALWRLRFRKKNVRYSRNGMRNNFLWIL